MKVIFLLLQYVIYQENDYLNTTLQLIVDHNETSTLLVRNSIERFVKYTS